MKSPPGLRAAEGGNWQRDLKPLYSVTLSSPQVPSQIYLDFLRAIWWQSIRNVEARRGPYRDDLILINGGRM